MTLCILIAENVEKKIVDDHKLGYCSWHSDFYPVESPNQDFFGYYIGNDFDGFKEEKNYRFIWDKQKKICYDNCNHKGRMDKMEKILANGNSFKFEAKKTIDKNIKEIQTTEDKIKLSKNRITILENKLKTNATQKNQYKFSPDYMSDGQIIKEIKFQEYNVDDFEKAIKKLTDQTDKLSAKLLLHPYVLGKQNEKF